MLYVEDKVYEETHRVQYYQCDTNKRLKLGHLMWLMQEAATEHYTKRGFDRAYLEARGSIFLLSKIRLEIRQMPLAGEELRLYTWERGPKRAEYIRDYSIQNGQGEALIEASTAWLVVDPVRHKLLLPATISDMTNVYATEAGIKAPEKLRFHGELRKWGEEVVRYSGMDCNGHLNNAEYGNLTCNMLEKHMFEKGLATFQISFQREALGGQMLELYTGEENGGHYCVGKVEGKASFDAFVTFQKEK